MNYGKGRDTMFATPKQETAGYRAYHFQWIVLSYYIPTYSYLSNKYVYLTLCKNKNRIFTKLLFNKINIYTY